jgi:hypothetical protein
MLVDRHALGLYAKRAEKLTEDLARSGGATRRESSKIRIY